MGYGSRKERIFQVDVILDAKASRARDLSVHISEHGWSSVAFVCKERWQWDNRVGEVG